MMEALGSMAITGSTLFGYNRKNFMYDRKMRQEQEFTIAEMRLRVADLWREDVRDVTELTERKMDTYMVVNILQLGFAVTLFIEGRLESGTPQWLLWLYMCTLSGAFMFLLLSVWMAMHASVVTQSSAVRLLTQLVRPPVPSWEQLESMRTYASSFEAVNTFQMFRVPVLQTLKEGRQAGAGGFSGSAEAEPGSVAADPWGLERRGDDLYELSRRPPAAARHVRLLREASKHWRAYDAFARVTMTIGTILLCQALGYFCQGYLLINDGAPWASWTVMGIMLAIASTVLRLDVSMTKSEYRQTQALLLIGPSLSCVVGAAWATWEVRIQRFAWILLPPIFVCHALFLVSFLRLCRVVEQPCGSILPLSFRSVLYLDVFGWLTKSGKVKVASGPSARCLKPSDPEYDSGPLITCKDVCDVLPKPGECLLPDVTQEAKLDAKDKQVVRQVGKMLSSFSSGAVQEHMDDTDRTKVRRLSQRLGELDPDVRGVDSDGHAERSADWVQLNTYSDCGRKVPYYVHVDSGKVSHAAPSVTPEPSPVSDVTAGSSNGAAPVGLLPSLSFAEQQVEAIAAKAQNIVPNGPPVSFAPPTSDRLDRNSSSTPGYDRSPSKSSASFFGSGLASDAAGVGSGASGACSAASGGRSSRRMTQLRSRRASFKAVHGQNFPRYFAKTGAPQCLRPEDADSFAASPAHLIGSSSGSGSAGKLLPSGDSDVDLGDDVDEEEAEEEDDDEMSPGGMQGIGPVGVVPEASADTFDPTSFAPEASHHHHHHRRAADASANADASGAQQTSSAIATGRDLFKPGQLPWYTFRSAVRLLAGLFFLGSLWSTLQSLGIPDIPDYVLPTSVHVSGARRGERSHDESSKSLYEDLLAKDEALPSGQRVLAQWPSPRFQPRGLSADPKGHLLVISDEFDIYIASYTEEPSSPGVALGDALERRLDADPPKAQSTGRLEFFRQMPTCAALEGQAIRDVALVCAGPYGAAEGKSAHEAWEASGCTVMVLHSRGERVASCTAEADEHGRQLDEDEGDDHDDDFHDKKASKSNDWRVSGKWLRDLGQPSIQEQVLSVVVDPDCQTPENLHERDSCMVVGTSHGRVIALRPHLEIRSELVPSRALWNVLGRAAVAEKVHGLATSLMTAIPGGFVLSLRQDQRKLQAIDVVKRRVFGKWTLPSQIGRKWTALAGGASHIFLSSQGGACADAPARWVDSKGYSCQDYAEKRWCTADGKYGNGWDAFWGGFDRFVNSKHTAMTACCACGGGDREDEGSTSQIWKFPLPEDLRAEVATRLAASGKSGEEVLARAAD